MPIYEYRCTKCSKYKQKYKPLDKYNELEYCECGYEMEKIISNISLGYTNKFKEVERKASEEGFILREPGLDKDAKRAREYKEQERRRNIRKTVEQTVMDHVL